jgi:ubiquitin thioesterase protein OTUB1
MVTSAQIRSEPEEYRPFLVHPDTGEQMGVKEFCETFVEVLGKEAGEQPPHPSPLSISTNDSRSPAVLINSSSAGYLSLIDHVQLTAISQALKVNLNIAYLDGRSEDGRVEFVKFNHATAVNETPLTLIYRWVSDGILFSMRSLFDDGFWMSRRPGHYDVLDKRSSEPDEIAPSEHEEAEKKLKG